ncbi:MAG TPA: rhodanese-like domain-containing protein [Bacteroidales bacterium]|nr:rhodanese-like domain-containing protein [Bacteroidales bacterium]HRZ47998.1 rhodanese-like domain-containing protein [Bacteroidales bacterium]
MNERFFEGKGYEYHGIIHVTPRVALELCRKGALIIDVRENYHSFLHTIDVEQHFFCPASELDTQMDLIPHDTPVIIADAAGLRSVEVVIALKNRGFDNIANLAGGILEWVRDDLPVIKNKKERMSGSCMCMLKYRERKPGQKG